MSSRFRSEYHLAIQLALIAGVALATGYPVPDFSDSNWLTVLFLTPIGIFINNLATDQTVASFYFDTSSGQVAMSTGQWIALAFTYFGLVANAVVFALRSRRSRT